MAGNIRVAGMPWWLRNRGVMVLLDIIEYYYHSIFFHDNYLFQPNLLQHYSPAHSESSLVKIFAKRVLTGKTPESIGLTDRSAD